ncbi:hypothetical protein RJ640_004515 [Escallonia rubra]|uniref:Fe2OG dioxygenase domain-containing protein n=1 Tax=Escallonia rubra TaxID=112253 RepID=A0AA88RN34_9ASTE|nr:hypothetical protein RJ640_004515 [Escallonia rubra]
MAQSVAALGQANDIPVVDLSGSISSVVAEIAEACEKWGGFQVINHGVPLEVHGKFELAMKKFFAQPTEEKRKEACTVYGQEMEKLSFKLMELIAMSLGLPRQRLNGFFKDHTSMGRLIHCPPCPTPQLALGTHEHTDVGALTILSQDEAGGLEAQRTFDGEWIPVKFVPNAYVINIGDMLEVWSNKKYVSLVHRAKVNSERERFSIPFFFNPAYYVVMEPIEELTNEQNPAKYRAFNWGKYYGSRKYGNFKNPELDVLRLKHFRLPKYPDQKVVIAMAQSVAALGQANDIPVVDLSGSISSVVAEIAEACEKWGGFQVINHGVPLEVHGKFELAMKKFFAQPTEEKRKLRKDIGGGKPYDYGYEEFSKNVDDWKEVFDFPLEKQTPTPVSYDDNTQRELIHSWPQYPAEFR